MNLRLNGFLVLTSFALATVAVGCGDKDSDDTAASDDTAVAIDGEALFQSNCESCHGPGGDGSAGAPALNATSLSRDDFCTTVADGVDGTSMPAFSSLSSEECGAIYTWVTGQ